VKPRKIKYKVPNWDYIHDLLVRLARKIKQSGFEPDIIVGISRGGWPPARVLSDLLDNPNLANIKVEFYLDIYKTAEKPRITQSVSMPVKGKRVLIVDDVADTGETLKLVHDYLLEEGATEVKICTIYFKPWSIVTPDFYARKTKAWVVFPWAQLEDCIKIGEKLVDSGMSKEKIREELLKIGFPKRIVQYYLRYALKRRCS